MDYVIYIPNVAQIAGIIMYYHPTLFGISEVPTSGTSQINAFAGLYVTSGYAIIFINYLGYNKNDDFPHPYVTFP